MGYDGSGNYGRSRNFSADASAGIKILASAMDQELNDFASAMTLPLLRDGQNSPTADIPMGGFKLTNVAAPASATNYTRAKDLIENVPIYMVDAETSTDRISVSAAYFVTASAGAAPPGGTGILIKMGSDKGSAPVLYLNAGDGNPSSANVVMNDGSALYSGAIQSGGIYEFIFGSSVWHLMNPTFRIATTDTPGLVEAATTAEAQAGTDTTRYITPATLADKFSADYATTASAGLMEIATTAEATAGSNISAAITPSTLHTVLATQSATTASAGTLRLATTAEVASGSIANAAITPAALPKLYAGVVICAATTAATTTVAFNALASAWTIAKIASGTWDVTHNLGLSNGTDCVVQITQQANTTNGWSNNKFFIRSASVNDFRICATSGDGGGLTDISSNIHISLLRIA